jgi:hypothetical protein
MEPTSRNIFGQKPLSFPSTTGTPKQTAKQLPIEPPSLTKQLPKSEDPFVSQQTEAEYRKKRVEETLTTSKVKAPSPTVAKQIEIINSVMKEGILTKLRAQKLGISIIQSADRNQELSDKLCLNYVHSDNGCGVSLVHPSKGGIPVLLERENDPLVNHSIMDLNFLCELSERAHSSMLFVLLVEKVGDFDAKLNLLNADGKQAIGIDNEVMISQNLQGCMETRANGTVTPSNIAYLILPERLKPYRDKLNITDSVKLIFVKSVEIENIPYNVGNKTKAYVSIACPDFQGALESIQEGEIFTHMLRGPTNQEIGK